MILIKNGNSELFSPCLLVPKPDGTPSFCIVYRKVNDVIKKHSYPYCRIDDCVGVVGQARFISKD